MRANLYAWIKIFGNDKYLAEVLQIFGEQGYQFNAAPKREGECFVLGSFAISDIMQLTQLLLILIQNDIPYREIILDRDGKFQAPIRLFGGAEQTGAFLESLFSLSGDENSGELEMKKRSLEHLL